jgi:arylsulfatase A
VEQQKLALYDLESDPGETRDIANENAEVVARLKELAGPLRESLGDTLTGVKAREARPLGVDE